MSANPNLYAQLAAHFSPAQDAPCLILPDQRVWTYRDIEHASARIANLLIALGLQHGDRVAVQVDKTPEALVLYLATLRAGMAFLPLNTAYQTQELAYFLSDAQPALFVCRPAQYAELAPLAEQAGVPHLLTLNEQGIGSLITAAAPHADHFVTVQSEPSDLAAILYTSGTTGRAKGAMLSHRNLLSNAQTLSQAWQMQQTDVLLHILPIFHIHGLFVACHCVLLNGAAMFFEPRFDVRRALELLPQSTLLMGVPTHYTRLLASPELTPAVCKNMRLFISGSAPLQAETFNAFVQRTGHTLLERYGMTEGGMYTSNPYRGERRCGSVGQPLPRVDVRIVDADGQPCAIGEPGHLEVKGDNVFAAYWRLPEKTAEEFTADGYFRTGDIAYADEAGYIFISGRAKDLIISGGLNVYPKEIEAVIDAIPGVAESAVIGLPHPDFGEAVSAVVVPAQSPAGAALSAQDIITAVQKTLANFKVPKRVMLVKDLPRNAMGKVQKNVLRQQYA